MTSLGQLLISVDYMMKSLWHGAYFPKEKRTKFNDKWREHFQVSKQNGKPEKEKSFLSDFLSHGTVLYSWIVFVKQSLSVSLSLFILIFSVFYLSLGFLSLSLLLFLCLTFLPTLSFSFSLYLSLSLSLSLSHSFSLSNFFSILFFLVSVYT